MSDSIKQIYFIEATVTAGLNVTQRFTNSQRRRLSASLKRPCAPSAVHLSAVLIDGQTYIHLCLPDNNVVFSLPPSRLGCFCLCLHFFVFWRVSSSYLQLLVVHGISVLVSLGESQQGSVTLLSGKCSALGTFSKSCLQGSVDDIRLVSGLVRGKCPWLVPLLPNTTIATVALGPFLDVNWSFCPCFKLCHNLFILCSYCMCWNVSYCTTLSLVFCV